MVNAEKGGADFFIKPSGPWPGSLISQPLGLEGMSEGATTRVSLVFSECDIRAVF